MAKSPAFRFYPRDYLADERVNAMSYEQRGVYMQALCLCWLEGSLPSDPATLAAMFRIAPRRFARLWPGIRACFTAVENSDRLVQKRLEVERRLQKSFATRAQHAAQVRWGNAQSSDA